jgi:hypothetical protein
MTAPLSRIIEGLRTIERKVTPHSLARSGAVVRESEGHFLLDMVADARETLEEIERRGDEE